MIELSNKYLKFRTPKINHVNKYILDNCKISIRKQSKIKNENKSSIIAILSGGLVDKKKRYVLSPGDIVNFQTINKLAKTFKINKTLTTLTISKFN